MSFLCIDRPPFALLNLLDQHLLKIKFLKISNSKPLTLLNNCQRPHFYTPSAVSLHIRSLLCDALRYERPFNLNGLPLTAHDLEIRDRAPCEMSEIHTKLVIVTGSFSFAITQVPGLC